MIHCIEGLPFQPFHNALQTGEKKAARVVVELPVAKDAKTASGLLYIPDDAAKNDAKEVTIVAYDDERVAGLELGQKVIVMKFRSQVLHHDNRQFQVVDADEDVLATVAPGFTANKTGLT